LDEGRKLFGTTFGVVVVFQKLEVTNPVRYSHKVENVPNIHVLFRTNSDFVQNKSQNFCSVKTIEHSGDYTDDYDDTKID
jgi:hypothetical protein